MARGEATIKVYVGHVHVGPLEVLADAVATLDRLGVAGFLTGDHLFIDPAPEPGAEPSEPSPAADPFVTLAAVGALSPRLEIGTLVANTSFGHPALVLRHFSQLAGLYGGGRVLAGLGAGWNAPEYEALGLPMRPLAERMSHLEAAASLARQWFDTGVADVESPTVTARRLPMSPRPDTSPRILLGGGSERLLALAGRVADHVDLHPLVSWAEVRAQGGEGDIARFLATPMAAAERAVATLEASEVEHGRSRGATARSIWMGFTRFCDAADIREQEAAFCAEHGLPPRDLSDCPYVLVGPPDHMAALLRDRRDRLGLNAIMLPLGPDLERFMLEVLPQV